MLKQPVASVKLTNVAVVRLKRGGKRFEVACFRNKAMNFRDGAEPDLDEVLQTEQIFANVSRGETAKTNDLKKLFTGMTNRQIAREILKHGELQMGDKERETEVEKGLRDIATFVAGRLFNTATKLPLSTAAAESLLKEVGFSLKLDVPVKVSALKALHTLCEAFPTEIARTSILVRLDFKDAAAVTDNEDLRALLLKVDALPQEKSAGKQAAADSTNSVTFFCDPVHYREIDAFAQKHSATLHVLSSRECIVRQKTAGA